MSATANLFVMLLLAASPGDELAQPASGNVEKAVRPPHELRRAVHDALKRSAPASDPEPADTVPELIALFKELRTDTQIEQFDRKRSAGPGASTPGGHAQAIRERRSLAA